MREFRKKIQGIDFVFEFHEQTRDKYYRVTAENLSFQMRLDENGLWKIQEDLVPKIKRLEYKLGKAIDSANEPLDEI